MGSGLVTRDIRCSRISLSTPGRSRALAVCGVTFGALTLTALFAGLLLRLAADLLPSAWIVGGLGALVVGSYLIRRPSESPGASPDLR